MIDPERRGSPRFTPARGHAQLRWWEGEQLRVVPARLEDLGSGGAAITATIPPPSATTAWIRLAGPGLPDWADASIVGAVADGNGSSRIRLAFGRACPDSLFRAAVWGLGRAAVPAPPRAPKGPASARTRRHAINPGRAGPQSRRSGRELGGRVAGGSWCGRRRPPPDGRGPAG